MFTHHWRQHGWWNEQPACCAIEQEDHPLVFFFIFAVESKQPRVFDLKGNLELDTVSLFDDN